MKTEIEEIEKEIKMFMQDVKSCRCRAKTGNWCLSCETANAQATGLNRGLELIRRIEKELKDHFIEDWDFSKKAKAEPYIHFRRILEAIHKIINSPTTVKEKSK